MIEFMLTMIGYATALVFSLVFLLIAVPVLLLVFWAVVRVLNKMGYSGWWSLLILIPPLALVAVWILAFSDWPAERRTVILYPPERG